MGKLGRGHRVNMIKIHCIHAWNFQIINKKFKRNNGFFIFSLPSCSLHIMNSNFLLFVQFASTTLLLDGCPFILFFLQTDAIYFVELLFLFNKSIPEFLFLLIVNTSLKCQILLEKISLSSIRKQRESVFFLIYSCPKVLFVNIHTRTE